MLRVQVAVALLACTCAWSQTELLRQTAATYAGAASVDARGTRVTMTRGEGYEQRSEAAFTLQITGGEAVAWTYSPDRRTYSKLTGDAAPRYERLEQGAKFVRRLRVEQVSGVECAVLEVQYDKPVLLWIDLKRMLVMRQEVAESPTVTVTTTFTSVELNSAAKPAFRPPDGSREASEPLVLPSLRDLNGKAAFNFDLPGADGKRYRLSDFKGKVAILVFWATWCGPCVADLPEIERFHKRNKDGGVAVIGINAGEDADTVKAFLKTKSITYPMLLAANTQAIGNYQVAAYPTAFAISRQGAIAGSQVGARGQAGLNELLAAADVWEAPPAPQASVSAAGLADRPVLRRLTESAVMTAPAGKVAPRVLVKEEPGYTDLARRAKLSGNVLIGLDVLPDGKPQNVRVARPLGMGLDEAAVKAVEKWQFEPGTQDGQPVTVATTVEVSFRMLAPGDGWRLVRAQVEGPVLIRYVAPESHIYGSTAEVTVSFEIDGTGRPREIRFADGVDRHMANDIRDAVAQLIFTANKPGKGTFVFALPDTP